MNLQNIARNLWNRKVSLLAAAMVSVAVFTSAYVLVNAYAATPVVFKDNFNSYPDGLLTSEFTFWNPSSPLAKQNDNWEMNSGSLFAQNKQGYSGVPTHVSGGSIPNPTPTDKNHSAIFRMTSKRADFGNVKAGFKLNVKQQLSTSGTPTVAWDGIHIFLRYQSEYSLYYASVNRHDGSVVVKKKCVGGTENGGTYYTLGGSAKNLPIPLNKWQDVAASVQNNADGSVTISLYRDGNVVHKVTDKGTGCAVISAPGKVGIRGDNTEFLFDNFTVSALDTSSADTQAPAVSVTAPKNGSTVSGTINLAASASDNVGITKVEYWLDDALLNATSAEPYTYALATSGYTNGAHTLMAKAYDAAGNVGTSPKATFTVKNSVADTQAPTAPADLRVTGRTQSSVTFAWAASTDTVGATGYNVYRNGEKLKSVAPATFVDDGLQAATPYNYTVEAYDAAGNTSPRSSSLNATTLPPAGGGGISATAKVTSDWNNGYCVEVTVTNNGTSAVTSWKTSFTTPGIVKSAWNVGQWGQSGNTVTVASASWNGKLAAGKSVTDIGVCAKK